jgi:hypothetical protein
LSLEGCLRKPLGFDPLMEPGSFFRNSFRKFGIRGESIKQRLVLHRDGCYAESEGALEACNTVLINWKPCLEEWIVSRQRRVLHRGVKE